MFKIRSIKALQGNTPSRNLAIEFINEQGSCATLRRLTTVSSNFKLLNFDEPILQIFISCCYNNGIKQMSNHC